VGVFADVQERLDGLSELLIPLAQEPVRLCLISGDLTDQGKASDLKLFQAELERYLPFPCYATMGNHELGTPGPPFFGLFGRASFSFNYSGVQITLLDDASATIAPRTRNKLKGWLRAGREQLHVVVTHLPILDADGTRSGAFASRLEATELLAELAQAGVDLLLYGHVHTYKAFKQAGIPAIISGGGGSIPMRLDGVGRHYLVIELDSLRQVTAHRIQEITPSE
jgi:3',5'-cyclic AMP phosphodiesterase CpdA